MQEQENSKNQEVQDNHTMTKLQDVFNLAHDQAHPDKIDAAMRLRPCTTMSKPSCASAKAAARPMPRVEPVMRMVWVMMCSFDMGWRRPMPSGGYLKTKRGKVSTKLKFGKYLDWMCSTWIVPANRICRNG